MIAGLQSGRHGRTFPSRNLEEAREITTARKGSLSGAGRRHERSPRGTGSAREAGQTEIAWTWDAEAVRLGAERIGAEPTAPLLSATSSISRCGPWPSAS